MRGSAGVGAAGPQGPFPGRGAAGGRWAPAAIAGPGATPCGAGARPRLPDPRPCARPARRAGPGGADGVGSGRGGGRRRGTPGVRRRRYGRRGGREAAPCGSGKRVQAAEAPSSPGITRSHASRVGRDLPGCGRQPCHFTAKKLRGPGMTPKPGCPGHHGRAPSPALTLLLGPERGPGPPACRRARG